MTTALIHETPIDVPAVCQFQGWNAPTTDRPKTVNNMKKKPTLDRRWAKFMPAYRQLGNRVSWLVDVKYRKKIRTSEKTYRPPLSFSLPNRIGKIAPVGMFP
ncbi:MULTISPECIES: hypothetical protein [unclassified Microcoleus]|uniref:hypothetical protein n=1 Tax=unclassified Microcoleus TaxID=2642155 RepID=UPI002FD1D032